MHFSSPPFVLHVPPIFLDLMTLVMFGTYINYEARYHEISYILLVLPLWSKSPISFWYFLLGPNLLYPSGTSSWVQISYILLVLPLRSKSPISFWYFLLGPNILCPSGTSS
jgi:hypothetical protein